MTAPGAPITLKRPRLGFAGLGWIGRDRMTKVAQAGIAEIRAVADPAVAISTLPVEYMNDAVAVQEFDELLDLDLDGIVIATPSALHAEQTIRALRRGCAVFCQKPLARNAPEAQAVIEAAADANRLLGLDLSYRHTAGMRIIRELIAEGQLGDIYAIELVFHNVYGPDKPWFYQPELSGGGCLIDLGTHLIDLALWCLDFPSVERIAGTLLSDGKPLLDRTAKVEDFAAAQIQLASGAVIQLACSWRTPAGCDCRIEANFHGTKGGAGFHNVNGSFYHFTAEHYLPDRSRRLLAAPPDDWGGRAINDWACRLAKSPEFDPEIERAHETAALLDAIYAIGS